MRFFVLCSCFSFSSPVAFSFVVFAPILFGFVLFALRLLCLPECSEALLPSFREDRQKKKRTKGVHIPQEEMCGPKGTFFPLIIMVEGLYKNYGGGATGLKIMSLRLRGLRRGSVAWAARGVGCPGPVLTPFASLASFLDSDSIEEEG